MTKKLIKSIFQYQPFKVASAAVIKLGFKLNDFMKNEALIENNLHQKLSDYLEKPVVLNGSFKGMKYVSASTGSAFIPKIIGSYESELHQTIESFCQKSYNEIFDIGCAEGYYAVGLALRLKDAKVHAFDINPSGRRLCKDMAVLNQVQNRVFIGEACTPEILSSHQFKGRNLIIADCEGYESALFTEEVIRNLSTCDLIIESHDFININISAKLSENFSKTHNLRVVTSVDDIQKAKYYEFPQVKDLTLEEKFYSFRERRPSQMEWLIFTPKESTE